MRDHVEDLLSAHIDGELAADERARVEEHLRTCGPCSGTRDELIQVDGVSREWQGDPPEEYFDALPGRVRARIQVAAARRQRVKMGWLGTMAAGIAAVALLSQRLGEAPPPPAPAPPSGAAVTATVESEAPDVPEMVTAERPAPASPVAGAGSREREGRGPEAKALAEVSPKTEAGGPASFAAAPPPSAAPAEGAGLPATAPRAGHEVETAAAADTAAAPLEQPDASLSRAMTAKRASGASPAGSGSDAARRKRDGRLQAYRRDTGAANADERYLRALEAGLETFRLSGRAADAVWLQEEVDRYLAGGGREPERARGLLAEANALEGDARPTESR